MLDDCTTRFLTTIGPLISAGNLPAVVAQLDRQWPPERLVEYLECEAPAVVALAARCLGYLGAQAAQPRLLALLRDSNPLVHRAAEDALWHLWMQGPTRAATAALARAVEFLSAADFDAAERHLRLLIGLEPEFAEPYHQLGLLLHSQHQLDEAHDAYHDALLRNPSHFSALLMCGHLELERDQGPAALDCYEQALAIHPHLPDLERIVYEVRADLRRRSVA